jgi:hypothetical protein
MKPTTEDKRTRGRQQEFIGARRRGRIIAAVKDPGSTWHGRRGRMRIIIRHDLQPTLEGARISFHATLYREAVSGQAGTVAEAIEKLEILYRDRTITPRPEKPKRAKKEPAS